ncbi:competence type IV pilus ATPase ComGA [Furfurilactobacillus entadae]|uniref:competence type IV pilus ATPase ComGA n=1 Tax=Furfurilactobacillus entadae TaxID=2922307 RepID=UPI0035EEE68D
MQPAERLIKVLIWAMAKTANDIYLFPKVTGYEIIIHTVAGVEKLMNLSASQAEQLMAYVKYQANMSISDHRRPQLGALSMTVAKQTVHLRLSTVGDFQDHESMVIRIIYPLEAVTQTVHQGPQWAALSHLAQQRGLFILSGPTGSGKTTTIYQLAQQLADQAVVLTIEDPVEISEPRFIQLQVNKPAGMDYESLLKLALRHRPDVFVIGEIRDEQTAKIAVQAALSGHVVLSTVHAQSAHGVLPRLHQLGISLADLQQVITGVCYQRLLPGTTHPVVLYDWLEPTDLFNDMTQERSLTQQMTWRWHDALSKAISDGKVAATVATAYRAG